MGAGGLRNIDVSSKTSSISHRNHHISFAFHFRSRSLTESVKFLLLSHRANSDFGGGLERRISQLQRKPTVRIFIYRVDLPKHFDKQVLLCLLSLRKQD
jgi:hypothetical protein